MSDTKIQWHPGFVSAIDLELGENRDDLFYDKEYNLNTKPLEIDLLVIKKNGRAEIANEIGKIFRGHNIMEYKSPDDHLDIDAFYKAEAYACLYKAGGGRVDERRADDITVSLVRHSRPDKLFRYFKAHGIAVENPYRGIYYILDGAMFRTQVIVARELAPEGHVWLKALSNKMGQGEMRELLEKVEALAGEKYERELAESVLEVSIRANRQMVDELRGDERMCQVLLEIMEPEINMIKNSVADEVTKSVTKDVTESVTKKVTESVTKKVTESVTKKVTESVTKDVTEAETQKSIQRAVKSFHDIGIGREKMRELLINNYGLTSDEAMGYLSI